MRNVLRRLKVQARNNLSLAEREKYSKQIAEKILASEIYQKAQNIMIYKAVRAEVDLSDFEAVACKDGKTLYYPLCISKTEMIALSPYKNLTASHNAWQVGVFGIEEPVRQYSDQANPEELDLIICPCTVFDEQCGRIGMGAGYYDRFLPKCPKAHVIAVAFEVQKTDYVPMETWDVRMDMIFTEKNIY